MSILHRRVRDFEGNIVATVMSVNALQASVAQAERLVQQDQARVSQDASRLERSQGQLTKDRRALNDTRRESEQAARPAPAATPAPNLNAAIERPARAEQTLPAGSSSARPQLNALGQTIGKLINVLA